MYIFLSFSGICYILYLYSYDKKKINTCLTYIKNFSYKINNLNMKKNNSDISDDYDLTDIEIVENTEDYYDNTGSTDFVEQLPIISRFYSFTKKTDNSNK